MRARGPGRGEAAGGASGRASPPRAPRAPTLTLAPGGRGSGACLGARLAASLRPGPAGARGEGAGAAAAAAAARAPARPAGGRPPRLRRQGENRAGAGGGGGGGGARVRRAPGAVPPARGCGWMRARRLRLFPRGAPVLQAAWAPPPPPPPPGRTPPLPSPGPALARLLRASLSPLNAHSGWEKKTTCSQVAINFRGGRSPGGGGTGGRARRLWSPTPARSAAPGAPA